MQPSRTPVPDTAPHGAVRTLEDLIAVRADLRDPILLAAWSGARGTSAAVALGYVAERWDARPVAALDPDEFFDFTVLRPSVRLEDGERRLEWPETRFLVASPPGAERDVVLLIGVEPHLRWRTYAAAVVATAQALGVAEALIVSAHRAGVPHTRETPLRLTVPRVGDAAPLAGPLGLPLAVPEYQGPTDIGGWLAIRLRDVGISVGTLFALAPFYVQVEPHPCALEALVRAIDRGLGTETDRAPIEEQVRAVHEQALTALARSEEARALLEQLEHEYDAARSAAPDGGAPQPLDAAAVLRDAEALLARPRDRREPDSTPRRRDD